MCDVTHMEFLGHYRPEEEEEPVCVCVDVEICLAEEDPRGTSHIHTYKNLFLG